MNPKQNNRDKHEITPGHILAKMQKIKDKENKLKPEWQQTPNGQGGNSKNDDWPHQKELEWKDNETTFKSRKKKKLIEYNSTLANTPFRVKANK